MKGPTSRPLPRQTRSEFAALGADNTAPGVLTRGRDSAQAGARMVTRENRSGATLLVVSTGSTAGCRS